MFRDIINRTFSALIGNNVAAAAAAASDDDDYDVDNNSGGNNIDPDEERHAKNDSEYNKIDSFSYILERKRINFDDQFSFTVRHLTRNQQMWMIGSDFASGIGFDEPEFVVDNYVSDHNKICLETLIFGKRVEIENDDVKRSMCINRDGCLQLLNHIEFANKSEFIAWLVTYAFDKLYSHMPSSSTVAPKTSSSSSSSSLSQLCVEKSLQMIYEKITDLRADHHSANENMHKSILGKVGDIENRLSELDHKISAIEKIDVLYNHLKNYHRLQTNNSNDTALYSEEDNFVNGFRLPRDSSKHPHLGVLVRSVDQHNTEIEFLTGQRNYYQTRKRKLKSGDLIYDSVHPNPQVAVHRFNEELDMKNLSYTKRNKRLINVKCNIDTAKSFINETI
ncbi:hypothetical protein [Helicoverpa armigera NPV NNg1]|uniref:Bro-N domain-containing protein n=1 Tax=Helicoverpa armigera NPV NNg1 TaxID=566972 RepID=B5X0C5_9ABAC|nr:hypothetical protein [Helicoverpa armigera NPV NNg1]